MDLGHRIIVGTLFGTPWDRNSPHIRAKLTNELPLAYKLIFSIKEKWTEEMWNTLYGINQNIKNSCIRD